MAPSSVITPISTSSSEHLAVTTAPCVASLYGGVMASTQGKLPTPHTSATNQACSAVSSTALAANGIQPPHLAPSAASRALIDIVFVS